MYASCGKLISTARTAKVCKLTCWPSGVCWSELARELLLLLPFCDPCWLELFESQLDLVESVRTGLPGPRLALSPLGDNWTKPSPFVTELCEGGLVDQTGLNGVDLPTSALSGSLQPVWAESAEAAPPPCGVEESLPDKPNSVL